MEFTMGQSPQDPLLYDVLMCLAQSNYLEEVYPVRLTCQTYYNDPAMWLALCKHEYKGFYSMLHDKIVEMIQTDNTAGAIKLIRLIKITEFKYNTYYDVIENAIKKNNINVLEEFINIINKLKDSVKRKKFKGNILMIAIEFNSLESVKFLANDTTDQFDSNYLYINASDKSQSITPLLWCVCNKRNFDMVKFLVDHGALVYDHDWNFGEYSTLSAPYAALTLNRFDIFEYINKNCKNSYNTRFVYYIIRKLDMMGKYQFAKTYYIENPYIKDITDAGIDQLFSCCSQKFIIYLIQENILDYYSAENKYKLLLTSIKANFTIVSRLLLEKIDGIDFSDINIKFSLLDIVRSYRDFHQENVRESKIKMMKFLLKNGVDPNIKGKDDQSAFDIATRYNYDNILSLLNSV